MKPKLRAIEAHPIEHNGRPMVLLGDPMRLSENLIAVPRELGPLLALMDGTRDESALEAALQVRWGLRLAPGLLAKLLHDLDQACLLDNERYASALADLVRAYREAPHRPLTVDAESLGAGPGAAAAQFQAYVDALPGMETRPTASSGGAPFDARRPVRGLVSPHIDYHRGGLVYAEAWTAAAQAAREAELVLFLGTDHQGAAATLTLTRQSYATPWGVLPTDLEVVDRLARALGHDAVFAEELHHIGEHSIELAANWLHFVRGGEAVPVVPILMGSFHSFVLGEDDPASYGPFEEAIQVLREVISERPTLVVAAADLAHMGPAFGDRSGLDAIAKAQVRKADERLMASVYAGDAQAFFTQIQAEGDRRHVCGLPPIYLTLRLLDGVQGEPAGYALCPADPQDTSIVSIAGAVLY